VAPIPSAATLGRLYGDEFFSKQARRGVLSTLFGRFEGVLFGRRARLVREQVSPAGRTVLDVGCGNGKFLRAMRADGWEVSGIEPSPAGAERARHDHGLEILCRNVLDVDMAGRRFDVITLWHVLEHVPEPAAYLRHVAQWLAPDGRLVVAVPNFAGVEARLTGPRWAFLDIPRHLFQFTPRSLALTAEQAGLAVVSDRLRLAEYGFPVTLLNFWSMLSGGDDLLLYNIIKRQHGYRLTPALGARLGMIALLTVLLFLPLLFLSLITELAGSPNGLIYMLKNT
jgi:SAM-dependent methyltransferase